MVHALQLGTLEKAMKVLDLFESRVDALTFSEIVSKTGLQKGSVQRLLYSMTKLGLLQRHSKTKRYSLAPRILRYAVAFCRTDPLVEKAARVLQPLTRQIGVNVSIAVMDGGTEVFYLTQVPNLVTLDFALLPVRRPVHCTAAGRAMLSILPEPQVAALLEHAALTKETNSTVTDLASIKALVAQAADEGFATQDEEAVAGEIGIAAPIRGDNDAPVASVTLSIDKAHYDLATARETFALPVRNAALLLSDRALISSFPRATS